jgi:hypothetical protein
MLFVLFYLIYSYLQGSHESESIDDAAADKRFIHRSLFGLGNVYPVKKVMTFNKHTHDFEFAVNYANMKHLSKTQLGYVIGIRLLLIVLFCSLAHLVY